MAVFAAQASAPRETSKASAAPHVAVAGRRLAVKISGLAAGHRGNVVVTGPHKFRSKLTHSTTLTKLRAGVYHVSVGSATAPHGARTYPTTRLHTVKVTSKKGASVVVTYTTIVPKSTKTVAGKTISKIKKLKGSQRQLTFSTKTSLKKGDVIVSSVSAKTPQGLLVKVVSVKNSHSVVVAPATLLDAVPTGQLDATGVLTSGNETAQARRAGLIPDTKKNGPIQKDVDEPLPKCSGTVKAEASGSISISPSFHLSASWSILHGIASSSLTSSITEEADLEASISAAGKCSGEVDVFKKPITFATFVVWVGSVPIVLQPQLQITLEGDADAKAAVTTSATQSLDITAGLQWKRGHGTSPIDTVTKKHSYQPPTLTASGKIEVSVNPEIDLLIDGIGGPEIGLTGGLELSADINANPWWTLDGYLSGNVGVTIPALKFDKRTTLVKKTWEIAHAPVEGVPSIEVSPDEVWPWSSSSACSTAGSSFEVQGSGFTPDSVVELSTDWASYGGVNTDAAGNFDVDEAVGPLPSADHTIMGVHLVGANGKTADGTISINSDACAGQSESNGAVTLDWGANGEDPDTDISLYINDEDISDATTDSTGSGSSTATFNCPDDGEFTYDIEGTDNGHSEHINGGPLTRACTPPGATPNAARPQQIRRNTSGESQRATSAGTVIPVGPRAPRRSLGR